MSPLIHQLKSIVLTSDHPDRTAAFYRDVLDIPLEEEEHAGIPRHFAGQFDGMHFAVHDRATFWLPTARVADSPDVVSFEVSDLSALLERLADQGIEVVARQSIGPMSFVALRDPDGRYVCCGTPWPEA